MKTNLIMLAIALILTFFSLFVVSLEVSVDFIENIDAIVYAHVDGEKVMLGMIGKHSLYVDQPYLAYLLVKARIRWKKMNHDWPQLEAPKEWTSSCPGKVEVRVKEWYVELN